MSTPPLTVSLLQLMCFVRVAEAGSFAEAGRRLGMTALMLDDLPRAKVMLGDRGYDADWFREALAQRGIAACIPSKINRKVQIAHDRVLYRQRHRIENMFGRLKDWRRIHTRYDRCADLFMAAVVVAATVIFWL